MKERRRYTRQRGGEEVMGKEVRKQEREGGSMDGKLKLKNKKVRKVGDRKGRRCRQKKRG